MFEKTRLQSLEDSHSWVEDITSVALTNSSTLRSSIGTARKTAEQGKPTGGSPDTNNMHYNAITGSYDSNLHLAVRHSPKAIKVLLRLGINTGLLNSNNETAADVARKIGREKDARRIERWNGSLRQRLVHISIRYTGVPPGKPGLKSFISVQSKIHP